MIKITFPDQTVKEFEDGVTPLQVAESISPRFAQDVLVAKVGEEMYDLTRVITADSTIEFFKWDSPEGKHAFWHSSAHLLAEALQELYPGIQFGIGPAIENGFYYDVVPANGENIKEADFPKIEKKMLELARQKEQIVRKEVAKAEVLKEFQAKGQTFKCELISELEDGKISTYTQGNFTDLCRGPHLPNTGAIKACKVLSVAGAFWRGNDKNPQMNRVYGITFPKQSMLDEYINLLEEAK